MKTDELVITENPATVEDALDKIELISLYTGMEHKDASRMRLLAEEMMSAIKGILSVYDGYLWMETSGKQFSLHLKITRPLSKSDRDKLITLSKNGKVTPQKGLFSRLGAAMEKLLIADESQIDAGILTDYAMFSDGFTGISPMQMYTYHYISDSKAPYADKEDQTKDELEGIEKNIISSIVDDLMVTVYGGTVELIAIKKM